MPYKEEHLDHLVAGPSTIEHSLRPFLSGVRLVGELDLTIEGEVYSRAKRACDLVVQRRDFQSLSRTCPASLLIFLVAEGRYRYQEGNFWSNVALSGISGSYEAAAVGSAFLKSLSRLGMETFEEAQRQENGHKYLMPILLHGGIPYGCAGDVWQLIREEVQNGADDGTRLVVNWRNKPFLMGTLDKPAQRFFKYGGEFACDLVQRMINLSELVAEIGQEKALLQGSGFLAAQTGLPSYLAETILSRPADVAKKRPRLPRPSVILDPYSGQGPSVRLPATKVSNSPQGHWTIIGPNTKTYKSSTFDELEIPLHPSREWLVELDTLGRRRLSTFAGFGRASVFFFSTPSGELSVDQHTLPSGRILALSAKAIGFVSSVDGAQVSEVEELPPLAGSWSAWTVHHLELSGLTSFKLVTMGQQGIQESESVFVSQSVPRPHFADRPIRGVVDLNGRDVFAQLPRLEISTAQNHLEDWRIHVSSERYDMTCKLADLARDGTSFSLTNILPKTELITARLSIVGPLGSDFRNEFTVIPGLEVSLPDRIITPSESVDVTVRGPNISLNHSGTSFTYTLPPGSDSFKVAVADGMTEVELQITVPRLLWTIRRQDAGTQPLSDHELFIGLDEIEAGCIESLLVRLGRTEHVQLRLLGDGRPLQSSDWVMTGGVDGRWAFSLTEFADTIRQSKLARLQLQLVHDLPSKETEINLASITALYEVSDIAFESIVSASETMKCCEVTFKENRQFRDREIRLWPRTRPWENPTLISMSEQDHNSCLFTVGGETPPGPYLLEIAIADPWSPRVRPIRQMSNQAEIAIGTTQDFQLYLDSLDASYSLEALELFLCERISWTNDLSENALEMLSPIAQAIVALLNEYGPQALDKPSFKKLIETSFIQPASLADWICHQAGNSMTRVELLQFAITVLPDALDCIIEPADRELLDTLWSLSPVFGALFAPYHIGDELIAACWQHFTGWNPAMPPTCDGIEEKDLLPSRGAGIDHQLTTISPERLLELATLLRPDEVKPLRWDGYVEGAFELLQYAWQDRPNVERWRSSHSRLNDKRSRLEKVHETYLDALAPEPNAAGWCRFPQDLLAAAFHLVSYSGERIKATTALWEASTFAPTLTERSLLIAIALHRLGA